MAVLPGTYNLLIPQRADLAVEVTLPIDGTGKTAVAEVWNARRSKLLLALAVEWIDRPAGRLRLTAPWDQTREVPANAEGEWDLLVVDDASGSRDFWLHGKATVDAGFTEVAP